MAVAALRQKPEPVLKMFHATLLVTRTEEWYVEAESAEQARELLAAGMGYRCHLGDCLKLVDSVKGATPATASRLRSRTHPPHATQ